MPLLSVIIPTRNRFDYVKYCIQNVLSISSPDVEVLVEDNSNSDQLDAWIDHIITDSRLRYHHSAAPISMVENYDRAVSRAGGEYLCLIGDDDGVGPEIIDAARWAQTENLDALVPTTPAHYIWPDLHLRSSSQPTAGELRIVPFTGRVAFPDAESEMIRCVRDAGQSFHALPKAYYGIVKRACVQRVKAKTGTCFPGVSPDMAVAMAVANYVDRICWIDYPLFVPGSSAKSNAGISGQRRHIGLLREQPHLPSTVEQDWSRLVPCFYSVETMWAEAAVGALKGLDRADLLRQFNVPRLYADCAMWHPEYIGCIAKSFYGALADTHFSALGGTLRFAARFADLARLRAKSLVSRLIVGLPPVKAHQVNNLENIAVAVRAFSEYLAAEGKSFGGITVGVST